MINEALRIRVIRSLLGLTSRDFALRLKISSATLTAWEKGRSSPQPDNRKELEKLCQDAGIALLPSGMPVPAADTLAFKEPQNG